MHPLVKRLLIRGPLVFVLLVGFAWLISYAAVKFFTSDNFTLQREAGISFGQVMFGLVGVLVLALLEWVSYAREQWRKKP